MNKSEFILKSVINECKMHAKRMNFAYSKVSRLFPLSGKEISSLNDENIALLDQLVYRFS